MTPAETEHIVREMMARCFNVEPSEILADSNQDNLPAWDSLGQMNLIMSLEENLGVSLNDQEVAELRSFEAVVSVYRKASLR